MTNQAIVPTGKLFNISAILFLLIMLVPSLFAQNGQNFNGYGTLSVVPEKLESAVLDRNKTSNEIKVNSQSDEEKAKSEERSKTKPSKALVTSAAAALELEKRVFEILNETRVENGLPPVVWNEEVAKVARMHSENMAKHKFFSHRGLDGMMVNDRADSIGFSKWRSIGENIAYNRGYEKPAEFASERWMQSPSHRENILDRRWKETAIGVAITEDGTYYFTQVFVLR